VAAARGLAVETGSSAFTVAQVVTRSGQSLKSFYRQFGGKNDLLLALLAEDIGVGAALLGERIDEHDEPIDRIRAWIAGLFDLMAVGEQGYVSVLVREHQRLSEVRPDEMDQAVGPFVDLLARELERGVEAGVVRCPDPVRDARMVLHLALGAIHQLVLGRDERRPADVGAQLFEFCWHGIGER
jgi:AcrR family transcriptional regulator